jgi:hypothetical protein
MLQALALTAQGKADDRLGGHRLPAVTWHVFRETAATPRLAVIWPHLPAESDPGARPAGGACVWLVSLGTT